jgi:hypothetical protein
MFAPVPSSPHKLFVCGTLNGPKKGVMEYFIIYAN